MKLRYAALLFLIAFPVSFAPPATAAESPAPIALQYHLSPSSAFSYQTTLKLSGEVKIPDEAQPEKLSADLALIHRMKVLSADARRNLTVENRLYDVKLVNGGQASATNDVPPITTVIAPDGKLLEAKGLEALMASNALPGLDPTTFGSLLNLLITLPSRPVKPGDSWTDDVPVQLPTGQKASAQRKLTLLNVEDKDGQASARIKTELSLPINVKVGGPNGGTLTGSQTGTGESRILLADGMPLEYRSDMKLEVVAKPTTPAKNEKGEPVDEAVTVVTTVQAVSKRVADKEPPKTAPSSPSDETAPVGDSPGKASPQTDK